MPETTRASPTRLTRRRFLALSSGLLAGLLAACRADQSPVVPTAETSPETPAPTPSPTAGPTATPAPATVRVWIEPDLPQRWQEHIDQAVTQIERTPLPNGVSIERTARRETADIAISRTTSAPARALLLGRALLAAVTSPRLPLGSVRGDQLDALLAGQVADWAEAGAPVSLPVQLARLAAGESALPEGRAALPLADHEELIARLPELPGALALVPVERVDYRLQTLVVDGVDPLMLPPDDGAWPYRSELFIEGSGPVWDELRPRLEGRPALAAPEPEPVHLTMVGDIILGRTVHTKMVQSGDFAAPFRLVADELARADLTIGNLECSLSDTITPPADPRTFAFMTYARGVEGLLLAEIDGVSQANNHSMDFGAQGMRDTLATLARAGIAHFGVGETLAEARRPAIFEVKGRRLAFLGYDGITGHVNGATESSPGTAPMITEHILHDIRQATEQADIVIPYMHWGTEYVLTPDEWQRELARRSIEAGATMVVGSHPHWVQGMEVHQGRPIVYSLGNFVFDQEWSLETKQGLIMHVVFRGDRVAALRFVPVLIEDFHRPRIVDGDHKVTILNRVWQSTDLLQGTA